MQVNGGGGADNGDERALRRRRQLPPQPPETPPAQSPAEFAHAQFRRRNRLEKRLEELQQDVASLTLKLRSNSTTRSHSTLEPHALADTRAEGEAIQARYKSAAHSSHRQPLDAFKTPSPAVKSSRKPRSRSSAYLLRYGRTLARCCI